MNKKTKSFQKFILLFLVIAISISIPQYQAHAGIFDVLGFGVEGLIEIAMSMLYTIPYLIGKLILAILVVLLYIAQWFIDILLDPLIYVGDAGRPGVLTSNSVNLGWTVVRDVCNMFFMFFLLIVAFGTMLRSKSINIKAILPKIIISLFLINFSKVFAFLIIDISQFFLVEISGTWMPGGMGPSALSLTSVTDAFGNKLGPVAQVVDWAIISLDELIMVIFAIIFSSVLLFIYMMLACFLIIRLTAFAVLIVFSPVAFLGIAFPALSQYSTQWWKEITKWAIFGPVFVFFIYLATTMANDLVGVEYDDFTGKWAYLQSIIVIIVPAIVPMAILLMAPSFAKSSGLAGASTLVGGRGGVGSISMGAYGLGKWGVGKTKQVKKEVENRSAVARKISNKGQAYVDKQTAKYLPGKRIRDEAKRKKEKQELSGKFEVEFGKIGQIDETMLKALHKSSKNTILKPPGGFSTSELEALMLANSIENDKSDTESLPQVQQYVSSAEATLDPKDFEEKVLNKFLGASTMTAEGQRKINNNDSSGLTGELADRHSAAGTVKEQKEIIGEHLMTQKVLDMVSKGESLNKFTDFKDKKTAQILYKNLDSDQRKKYVSGLNKPDQKEFAKSVAAMGLSHAEVTAKETDAKSSSSTAATSREELRKDLEVKIDAVDFGAELKKTFNNEATEIEKGFGRLDPKTVSKLSDSDLEEHGKHAVSSQIAKMHRDGRQDKVELIRDSVDLDKAKKLGATNNEYDNLQKYLKGIKIADPADKIVLQGKIDKIKSGISGQTNIDYKDLQKYLKSIKTANSADKIVQQREIDKYEAQGDIKEILKINKKLANMDSRIEGGRY